MKKKNRKWLSKKNQIYDVSNASTTAKRIRKKRLLRRCNELLETSETENHREENKNYSVEVEATKQWFFVMVFYTRITQAIVSTLVSCIQSKHTYIHTTLPAELAVSSEFRL